MMARINLDQSLVCSSDKCILQRLWLGLVLDTQSKSACACAGYRRRGQGSDCGKAARCRLEGTHLEQQWFSTIVELSMLLVSISDSSLSKSLNPECHQLQCWCSKVLSTSEPQVVLIIAHDVNVSTVVELSMLLVSISDSSLKLSKVFTKHSVDVFKYCLLQVQPKSC